MTIDKSKTVTLPVWLISVLLSLLITGFTTWGMLSSTKATLELKAQRNEQDIRNLQTEKVNKDVFETVLTKLNEINKKLDEHVKETK